MKKKNIVFAAGIAAVSVTFIKYKIHVKPVKDESQALHNGFELLNLKGKILVITPHPDDAEFFAGEVIKKIAGINKNVYMLDVTNGEKGTNIKDLASIRQKEQLIAAEKLGVNKPCFLCLPDMHLDKVKNLEKKIESYIRKIEPDVIITFDGIYPWRLIKHPDHIAVGNAVTNILRRRMDKKTVIIYYATRKPNVIVDISSDLKEKVDILKTHKSQLRFGILPYKYILRWYAGICAANSPSCCAEVYRAAIAGYGAVLPYNFK